ncbi:uncharacterized protein METZ01_LOCUS199383, partial [marine metagenome]
VADYLDTLRGEVTVATGPVQQHMPS